VVIGISLAITFSFFLKKHVNKIYYFLLNTFTFLLIKHILPFLKGAQKLVRITRKKEKSSFRKKFLTALQHGHSYAVSFQ